MSATDDVIAALLEDAARHPPERYPVQHATARFHLGVSLANLGRLDEAEESLSVAIGLFDDRLPLERALAANARGAVLRLSGRRREAAASFEDALEGFRHAGRPREQATARFNLGLVRADATEPDAAVEFAEAHRLFEEAGSVTGAAAAARELGGVLLTSGQLDEARAALEDALAGARAAHDVPGLGLAANLLGLVELSEGRTAEAVDAFRSSAAAHPRRVRPDGYAIARANQALAHEQAGQGPEARLAAGQALAVADAPAAARETAEAVLRRVGDAPGALVEVLEGAPPDGWIETVRSEVERWVDLDDRALRGEGEAWVGGLSARPFMGEDATAAWLGALVELPPPSMERLLAVVLTAPAVPADAEPVGYRALVERALARFPGPQFMRLSDAVARLSPAPDASA